MTVPEAAWEIAASDPLFLRERVRVRGSEMEVCWNGFACTGSMARPLTPVLSQRERETEPIASRGNTRCSI
jgi:hypothetical protein